MPCVLVRYGSLLAAQLFQQLGNSRWWMSHWKVLTFFEIWISAFGAWLKRKEHVFLLFLTAISLICCTSAVRAFCMKWCWWEKESEERLEEKKAFLKCSTWFHFCVHFYDGIMAGTASWKCLIFYRFFDVFDNSKGSSNTLLLPPSPIATMT